MILVVFIWLCQLVVFCTTELKDLVITSDLDLGHIIVVSLDDQPLATSGRILLQVMSEKQASGFATEPVSPTVKRIARIGHDPWQVKDLSGSVRLKPPRRRVF